MMYDEEMENRLGRNGYTVQFFCDGDECDIFFDGRYIETLEGRGKYLLYNWMVDHGMYDYD